MCSEAAQGGEHVFGWVASGYWEDVGSHAAYVKANFDCLEGKVKVQIPGDRVGDSTWIHPEQRSHLALVSMAPPSFAPAPKFARARGSTVRL